MRTHGDSARAQQAACNALANHMEYGHAPGCDGGFFKDCLIRDGVPALIVAAMRGHGGDVDVQVAACGALRLLMEGGAPCVAAIRDAGATAVLELAIKQHPSTTEAAQDVLRKL